MVYWWGTCYIEWEGLWCDRSFPEVCRIQLTWAAQISKMTDPLSVKGSVVLTLSVYIWHSSWSILGSTNVGRVQVVCGDISSFNLQIHWSINHEEDPNGSNSFITRCRLKYWRLFDCTLYWCACSTPTIFNVSEWCRYSIRNQCTYGTGNVASYGRRRWFDWLEAVKNGLGFFLVHVTYAPGGSVQFTLDLAFHCFKH